MIRTGTILSSRYEILEQIGSGGMAYVYKARDRKLSRLVAIKILKEEFCKDKSFVAKFRMEAQAAAGLSHNNVVGVYDVGEEDNVHYIVMELIDGITLKEHSVLMIIPQQIFLRNLLYREIYFCCARMA